MDLGLKGKKALVEGASSGLGVAIAEAFVKEGVQVAIASSSLERIKKAGSEIGAAAFFEVDLDKPEAGSTLVEKAAASLGGLDILVTNTGGPKVASFQELSSKDWEEGFRHLFMSAVESIQAALPIMKKGNWGRILLLTSCAAKEPISSMLISSSIRAGLLGLMKSVSNEAAPFGITVNSVLPGFIKTERLSHLNLDENTILSRIPTKRMGEPREVAALFAFLVSDAASYITGQAIACDGGYLKSF